VESCRSPASFRPIYSAPSRSLRSGRHVPLTDVRVGIRRCNGPCQLGEQHIPVVQPARGDAEHSDLVNRARPRIDEVDHRCGDALESAVDKKRLERSEAQDPKAFELQLVALGRIEIKDPICSVPPPEDEGVGAGAPEEKVEAGAAADRIRAALAEERVIVSPAQDDVVSVAALDVVVAG